MLIGIGHGINFCARILEKLLSLLFGSTGLGHIRTLRDSRTLADLIAPLLQSREFG